MSLKPVMHNEVVSQVQTLTTLLEGVLASKGLLGGQYTPSEPLALHCALHSVGSPKLQACAFQQA